MVGECVVADDWTAVRDVFDENFEVEMKREPLMGVHPLFQSDYALIDLVYKQASLSQISFHCEWCYCMWIGVSQLL